MPEDDVPQKVKVRTTFQPDKEIEMDRDEAASLRSQGLLHEGACAPVPAAADDPPVPPADEKAKAGKPDKAEKAGA